jgi:hypothetical protein
LANPTAATEVRLPAIANIPTAIANRPTVATEEPLPAIAISPTVDGDEGTQGASKKRGSTSDGADYSPGEKKKRA